LVNSVVFQNWHLQKKATLKFYKVV